VVWWGGIFFNRKNVALGVIKMHSVHNTIIVVPPGQGDYLWTCDKVRHICDGRRGIGADQMMVCNDPNPMTIWNGDGSRANACGNGTRCVIGSMPGAIGEIITLQGPVGPLTGWKTSENSVAVNQGPVSVGGLWHQQHWIAQQETSLALPGDKGIVVGVPVHAGNAHVVVWGEPPMDLDPQWQARNPDFPDGVNVSFVWSKKTHQQDIPGQSFWVNTWERGIGFSQGCGSAACAIGALLWEMASGNLLKKNLSWNIAAIPTYILTMPGGTIVVTQGVTGWVHTASYSVVADCTWYF
jgi:diaminopimelate epimerase